MDEMIAIIEDSIKHNYALCVFRWLDGNGKTEHCRDIGGVDHMPITGITPDHKDPN